MMAARRARSSDFLPLGTGQRQGRPITWQEGREIARSVLETAERARAAVDASSGDFQPVQTLILDGYPTQEQQDLLGPNRGSRRWGVAEERARVQQDTAIAAREQGIRPVPPPVRVTYRFVVPDKGRRDWDNYALICKPVQDGLVKAEILVGDHYAVLSAEVAFRVEKDQRRLEIEIAPAPAGPGMEE